MLHVHERIFQRYFHVILRSGKIKNRISGLTLWLDGANVITEKNVAPGNRVVLFSWQATVGARVTKSRREHEEDAHVVFPCNGGFIIFKTDDESDKINRCACSCEM